MYQEVGVGPYTVQELTASLVVKSRRFRENIRGIWPILGEGYIAEERWHE